ncbi:MAG: sugar phosphate isomerase/epimerase [Chloroflexi bacterium]|nr:sugar phosphate isomerase/epimerase [Chloroflexota bacterium]
MRVGLDTYTLKATTLNAHEMIDFAAARGIQGLQFDSAFALSPRLDDGEIAEARQHAAVADVELLVGIPCVNPHRPPGRVLQAGGGSLADGLARCIVAATDAGSTVLRTVMGGRNERHDPDVPWSVQLADVVRVVERLAPLLRERGAKLAFENHLDATTFDLLRLVERVGGDVAGICLDTGNTLLMLESPLAAAERVAPHVLTTHLKDAYLFLDDGGLCWQATPAGEGAIPLEAIVRLLARFRPELQLSIEDQDRIFHVPIFDPPFVAHYPELTVAELAALVQLAWTGHERITRGAISHPHDIEAVPWAERFAPRLERGVSYLKRLLAPGVVLRG